MIVGGGAVGLGCALFLQADGWELTLIDRGEPGQQTSSGNAGIIAVQSVAALNSPATLRKLPSLLVSRTSPLRLRWRDLWAIAPWLLAFARVCTPAAAAASSRAQAALARRGRHRLAGALAALWRRRAGALAGLTEARRRRLRGRRPGRRGPPAGGGGPALPLARRRRRGRAGAGAGTALRRRGRTDCRGRGPRPARDRERGRG
ncbi:MAG: FAD-dependent oxidoreductase [Alphaproteobacteria bacterium]